jgi:hypothetical protein
MLKETGEMTKQYRCLETGCDNVECEHLTWGPPHCMLRIEKPGNGKTRETKPSPTGHANFAGR